MTMESVLAQTWQNLEVIVVNDGSKDNSLNVIKNFESHNIKIINQPNRGASAARNRAFQEAQGDLIQFLDADDLLASDKIEQQVRILDEHGMKVVATCKWGRFFTTAAEAQFAPQPLWNDLSPVEWVTCLMEGGGMMIPAAWLVPRAIAERAGKWDETLTLNDDGEYFCRVVLASHGVKFCDEARCFYRSGLLNSLSRSTSPAAYASAFRCFELCAENLLAKENSPHTRRACAAAFQRVLYSVYPDLPELAREAEAKVVAFGGTDVRPEGGYVFKLLSGIIGWKAARRIGRIFYPVKLA